jgi:hypothetical protein
VRRFASGPATQFELATLATRGDVDTSRRRPLKMIVEPIGNDGVDGLLAAFEAVLNGSSTRCSSSRLLKNAQI